VQQIIDGGHESLYVTHQLSVEQLQVMGVLQLLAVLLVHLEVLIH
jgi:hypothetical protein